MPSPTYSGADFDGTFWTIQDGNYYVSTIGSDVTGDGSPQNPYLTVSRAFEDSADGDKIIIGPNQYIAYSNPGAFPPGGSGGVIACRLASKKSTNLDFITTSSAGNRTVDGQQTQDGDYVLVWQQTNASENGVYMASGSSAWARVATFDSAEDMITGLLVPVAEGSENSNEVFLHRTTGTITVGTTPIVFGKLSEHSWGDIEGDISNQQDLSDALDAKADKSNILELDNTTAYTPTADYHPTTKEYVDNLRKSTPGGLIDCSSSPNYPQALEGDYYYVSVAGKIGGTGGPELLPFDKIQCISTVGSPAGDHATVGANWVRFPGNLDVSTDARSFLAGTDFEAMRSLLNVDESGTDNSVDVSLQGTLNYLSLSGQQITLNPIDLATDVTGNLQASSISNGLITEDMLSSAVATKLNDSAPGKFDATTAPTVTDDSEGTAGNGSFDVGSVWIDLNTNQSYRCVDATVNAAVWIDTTLTSDELGSMAIQNDASVAISGGTISGTTINGLNFPTSDGTNGQFIKTNGSGVLSFADAMSAEDTFRDVGLGELTDYSFAIEGDSTRGKLVVILADGSTIEDSLTGLADFKTPNEILVEGNTIWIVFNWVEDGSEASKIVRLEDVLVNESDSTLSYTIADSITLADGGVSAAKVHGTCMNEHHLFLSTRENPFKLVKLHKRNFTDITIHEYPGDGKYKGGDICVYDSGFVYIYSSDFSYTDKMKIVRVNAFKLDDYQIIIDNTSSGQNTVPAYLAIHHNEIVTVECGFTTNFTISRYSIRGELILSNTIDMTPTDDGVIHAGLIYDGHVYLLGLFAKQLVKIRLTDLVEVDQVGIPNSTTDDITLGKDGFLYFGTESFDYGAPNISDAFLYKVEANDLSNIIQVKALSASCYGVANSFFHHSGNNAINQIAQDQHPKLGGDLNLNSNDVVGSGNINILGSIQGSNLAISNWNDAHGWGDHAGLYASISHNHSGVYEPVFTKNGAFNKNFGTASGTVAQGNDSRINNGQTAFGWGNHAGLYSVTTHNHSGVYEPAFNKNGAFNKNFGTASGTVAQGNDSRIDNGQTAFGWGDHSTQGYITSIGDSFTSGNNLIDVNDETDMVFEAENHMYFIIDVEDAGGSNKKFEWRSHDHHDTGGTTWLASLDELGLFRVNYISSVASIVNGNSTESLYISGAGNGSGGNIELYGNSHSSYANDLVFRAGLSEFLRWDNSAENWNFANTNLINVNTGTANTNWVISSDQRLKQITDDLPDALEIVRNLQGHRFLRTDLNDGVIRVGFMAQQVAEYLPEVVQVNDDKWTMDYASITALHNEALKSVDSEIDMLKKRVSCLESKLVENGISL
ncbi:MAG: tail fiber domain-containing protein [Cyclobacteriaceae bacterium]